MVDSDGSRIWIDIFDHGGASCCWEQGNLVLAVGFPAWDRDQRWNVLATNSIYASAFRYRRSGHPFFVLWNIVAVDPDIQCKRRSCKDRKTDPTLGIFLLGCNGTSAMFVFWEPKFARVSRISDTQWVEHQYILESWYVTAFCGSLFDCRKLKARDCQSIVFPTADQSLSLCPKIS